MGERERERESTGDIREVEGIALQGLRLYAEIKFSSKHNLLLLSEAAIAMQLPWETLFQDELQSFIYATVTLSRQFKIQK